MSCRSYALTLFYAWMIVVEGAVARAPGFTHWLVTEEGKIEFQIGSPFNLHQPFNLVALLQQEERVSSLEILRDELLHFRDHFEGFGYYDSFEESFYARVPECRNVPKITTFDLYVSTVLPLDHKQISLSDHLDPADSRVAGEPHCLTPLDYSIHALEHLRGVQERHTLLAPPEKSVLATVNMKVDMFGNLVHQALKQNETSWVLLDLATLYWRIKGHVPNSIECIRRALHYSPRYAADVAYLNLANILHRSHLSEDAVIPLKLAIVISPDVNVLHYTLGNVYVSMAELNESVSEFRYSLSLEPTSEAVLSVYTSVLCEIRKLEASDEYSRKLDETQAKLDEFYDKVELVKKTHRVEKGHRGQWDIDTSQRHAERDDGEEKEGEREGEREREREGEDGGGEIDERDGYKDSESEGDLISEENLPTSDVSSEDASVPVEDSSDEELSPNGSSNPVMPHSRGNSKLRLVLRPLSECGECQSCDSGPPIVPNSSTMDNLEIGWPVCRLPSPFLNYSRHTSGFCAETSKDCAEIKKRGKPGVNFCEVKGQSTRLSYTQDDVMATRHSSSLSCAIDENGGESDCLKQLQEQLRLAEQHRLAHREKMMKKEHEKPEPKPAPEKPEKPVTTTSSTLESPPLSETKNIKKPEKESLYSTIYKGLEFLPYSPLPTELDELIFPNRSKPLAIFDDPFWPGKANCISLVDSLAGTTASMSAYTGTYLSPNSKGADTNLFFKIVPYPVPPYLRQQPRCTDIVELPFSLQAYDHLYPVQYRSQLKANKKYAENGLKQVFINAVSEAMGRTLSFEESGETVYAAMVKNGPNWALFVVASLYWRVSGDPKHSIECLRRALHYSPNAVKDVSYVAMANVFHRHGYMSEAVIAARASLDVIEESPVGHYTMAGIYLTLRDYIGTSLHLRTSLHMQPTFEHALSALRLVRCFLKFQEEEELMRKLLTQPEGRYLLPYEGILAVDLARAIETLKLNENIRQPPVITKPEEVILREGGRDTDGYFTGEDAIQYMKNLALLRNKRLEIAAQEGEAERKERKAIEKRIREEISRVKSDGSLEEFIKRKREEEGENEFVKQVHYMPNQLDITPLMRQVANRIQAENNYDPAMIAQSRAEIEAELREIVVSSARAIANNQSPVQHTTPVRVIANDDRSPLTTTVSNDDQEKDDERDNEDEVSVEPKDDQIKRYPGFRPWPSLQECYTLPIPKTLVFTSTWLSVTAKRIKVVEHVDFESALEDMSFKPYCPANVPDLVNIFPNLASMNGLVEVGQYKPERGLIEVFTNLSGSYHILEDVATRIHISMAKNESSWILSNLATLYWRIHGDGEQAINCLKHALHYSGRPNLEVALVSLANVLYRLGYDSDATAVMQYSLEVNPKLVVNHFTMANLLAARGFAAESASYFESTLQFQPKFEPAAERLKAARCVTLLKHIQETREKEEKRQREYEAELERQLYERRKELGHFN